MSGNASEEGTLVAPDLALPEIENQTSASAGQAEGDWLCVLCHNRVANERDRFPIGGKDQFTFTNPEGLRFDIITFSETHGCRQTGTPTLEHTWFPGHRWSYCQCGECGQHLGSYFK